MTTTAETTSLEQSGGLMPALLSTTLIQVIATATTLALTAIAPSFARDLGIDASWIGYQVSLIYLAGMFSSAMAGTLVRRYGPVRIEQVALACCMAGFGGLALGNLAGVVAGSAFIGFGYGLNNPASSQILNRVTPRHRRNIVFSIKQAGVPLGAIVASVGFPFLESRFGWQAAFLGAMLVPAIYALILSVHRADWDDERDPAVPFGRGFVGEQRLVWGKAPLRMLAALGFLYSSLQLSVSAFMVVMLVQDGGWSLLAAGSVAAMVQACGAIGRIGWGVVADRYQAGFLVLGLIGLVSAACVAALFWIGHMPAIAQVLILCLLGACSIGWNGVLLAETARHSPRGKEGAVIGGTLIYTFIGVMIGPSGFAFLYTHMESYSHTLALFGLVSGLGGVAAIMMHGKAQNLRTE